MRPLRVGRLLAALLLAAFVASVAGDGRRQLKQSGPSAADCGKSVKNCVACRYQYFKGTVTKAVCTQCSAGYIVRATGRACYCAAGYYTGDSTDVTGAVGFTCGACGNGYFCPGAKVTAATSTTRVACGRYKITSNEYAKSERECVVPPGYGWGEGDTSDACPQGSYNPGYNMRKCTTCPGSLTTLGPNSTSSTDCMAGVGFYYLRGKAVACARGTYKPTIANDDCLKCPTGVSTAAGTVGNDSPGDCTVLLPGYAMAANPTLGTTEATECPQDTYRAGEVPGLNPSGAAISCTPCGGGMVTMPNVTKATTPDACVVPPGFGWAPGGVDGQGVATACPKGTYNPGYNREKCVPCGDGSMTTDKEASTSSDACYTPAGHGNLRRADGVLTGFPCPNGTYGRPANTYGLYDVECTKCLQHSTTLQEGSVGPTSCVTDPGYGYDDGAINQCNYGYWSAGGSQNQCTYCGDFYNTTADGVTTSKLARMGADSKDDCKPDYGFAGDTTGGLKPCIRGYFKDFLGWGACTQCPASTTTTIVYAATSLSDCDACQPGFGVNGRIDATNPKCGICPSGTYSPGYIGGGSACWACPKPTGFTGKMVSRRGINTPEYCIGEFSSDASMQNREGWDFIKMSDASLPAQPAYTTVGACHAACAADARCQYYKFDGWSRTCYHRLGAAPLGKVDVVTEGPSAGSYVMFEVKAGQYAAYPALSAADADSVGETVSAGLATREAALAACDRAAACIGLTFSPATKWRLFAGTLWENVTARVRVAGEAVNPWLAEPDGLEQARI